MLAKWKEKIVGLPIMKIAFILVSAVGIGIASAVSVYFFETVHLAGSHQNIPEARTYENTITVVGNPFILVLDAGHGGADPGALDKTETILEADINQQVVDSLLKKLENHPQEIQVILSHKRGESATSMERANVALKENADLLVSLHLNSDWNENLRGFQCFPLPPGRVYSSESLRFAKILVENMKSTTIPIMGTAGIYYTFYVQKENGSFAKEIYDSGWFDHDAPRREESFGVLEYSSCPAVLVEQWYISNQEDMDYFCNDAGIERMADKLYTSVCEYFGISPMG